MYSAEVPPIPIPLELKIVARHVASSGHTCLDLTRTFTLRQTEEHTVSCKSCAQEWEFGDLLFFRDPNAMIRLVAWAAALPSAPDVWERLLDEDVFE